MFESSYKIASGHFIDPKKLGMRFIVKILFEKNIQQQ